MKGYVINLKKRSDRLDRFVNEVAKFLPDINIETVEAVDGSILNPQDKFLLKNVNEWNFKYLPEKQLRGVIGCCMSHLKCLNKIINGPDDYALIFEDDCVFRSDKHKKIANEFIKNMKIPEKFGIIYLNEYAKLSTKECEFSDYKQVLSGLQTAEAYIISKEYAKIVYTNNIKNIGAIDAHMAEMISKFPEYPHYTLNDNLFIQYDRRDSNIR
jgi:GR25 family glycosyltransferase involved in LPS biosynthesis